MGELAGRVAIVTGASRMAGVGRAAALALAALGCDVAVTGTARDPSTFPESERRAAWRGVDSVADEVRKLGRRALPLSVDVTRADQVQEMVDRTLERLGRVDILVNLAVAPRGPDRAPVAELPEDVFRLALDVKVVGTFLCSKAVARELIRQGEGGKIVNVSSAFGKSGRPNAAAYSAANAAIHGFTMSFAREMAPHGVNVNAVCPGLLDTSRNEMVGRGEAWSRLIAEVPLGRAGAPGDVAGLIAYLCTRSASYIHGQCINVNGGSLMEH
jgi:NAD(P)-dependent dehydrogenase (short-subunit alcohol dehydrogenase family)